MSSTKSVQLVTISRANIIAAIAQQLNAVRQVREVDVYDIDFPDMHTDLVTLKVYIEKKEADRLVNGEKG